MSPFLLLLVFVAATLLGYKIISQVPSLLHTPLMSGMNALSGITVLGAVIAAAAASSSAARIAALVAIALAAVNIAGGFSVTHRMLRMFDKKTNGEESK